MKIFHVGIGVRHGHLWGGRPGEAAAHGGGATLLTKAPSCGRDLMILHGTAKPPRFPQIGGLRRRMRSTCRTAAEPDHLPDDRAPIPSANGPRRNGAAGGNASRADAGCPRTVGASDSQAAVHLAPEATGAVGEDATELAKKLQNPIGDLYRFPFQNNTNFNYGPKKGHSGHP